MIFVGVRQHAMYKILNEGLTGVQRHVDLSNLFCCILEPGERRKAPLE